MTNRPASSMPDQACLPQALEYSTPTPVSSLPASAVGKVLGELIREICVLVMRWGKFDRVETDDFSLRKNSVDGNRVSTSVSHLIASICMCVHNLDDSGVSSIMGGISGYVSDLIDCRGYLGSPQYKVFGLELTYGHLTGIIAFTVSTDVYVFLPCSKAVLGFISGFAFRLFSFSGIVPLGSENRK